MVLNTDWAQVEVIDLINDGSGLAFGIIGGRSTGVVVKTIVPGGVADRDGRLQSGDHILQIGEVNLRGLGSEQVASVLRQCGVHVRMVVARPVESTSADYQALGSHAPIVPTKILGDPVELDKHLNDNGYGDIYAVQNPSNSYSAPYIYTGQHTDVQLHSISGLVDVVRNPLPIGTPPSFIPTTQTGPSPAEVMLPLDMALREPSLPETETFSIDLMKDELGLGITVAGYVCEKEEISGIFVKSISKGSAADLSGRIKVNDRIIMVNGESVVGYTNHQAVEVLRKAGAKISIEFERYLRGPKYEQLQQAILANELRPTSPSSPTASSLPKIPLSLVHMSSLGIEPEGESRTSFDFDSAVLQDLDTPTNDVNEIVVETAEGRRSVQFSVCSQESIHEKWRDKLRDDVEIVIAEMIKEATSGLGISLEGTVDVEDGKEVRPHHYIRNILPNGPVGKNAILQSGDELLEVNGIQLLGLNHVEVVSILKQLPSLVILVCARYSVPTRIIDTAQHRDAFQARNILSESISALIQTSERLVKAKSDSSISSSVASETCCSVGSRSKSLEIVAGLPMWSDEKTVVVLTKGDHGLGFSILDYQDPLNPQETVIVIRSLVPGGVAQQDGRLIPGDRLLAVNDIDVEHASLDRAVQILKGAPKGSVKITVAKPLSSNDTLSHHSQDTEDDQTCIDDFQECIEEYQECLEVVQICIEEDRSFNHSPCVSQVEDLGINNNNNNNQKQLPKNEEKIDAAIEESRRRTEKNKTAFEEDGNSEPELSFKSLCETTRTEHRLLTSTSKNDSPLKMEDSEKDGYETCQDESFSEDAKFDDKTPTNSTYNLQEYKIIEPDETQNNSKRKKSIDANSEMNLSSQSRRDININSTKDLLSRNKKELTDHIKVDFDSHSTKDLNTQHVSNIQVDKTSTKAKYINHKRSSSNNTYESDKTKHRPKESGKSPSRSTEDLRHKRMSVHHANHVRKSGDLGQIKHHPCSRSKQELSELTIFKKDFEIDSSRQDTSELSRKDLKKNLDGYSSRESISLSGSQKKLENLDSKKNTDFPDGFLNDYKKDSNKGNLKKDSISHSSKDLNSTKINFVAHSRKDITFRDTESEHSKSNLDAQRNFVEEASLNEKLEATLKDLAEGSELQQDFARLEKNDFINKIDLNDKRDFTKKDMNEKIVPDGKSDFENLKDKEDHRSGKDLREEKKEVETRKKKDKSKSKAENRSREDLVSSRSKTDNRSREDLTASRSKTDDHSREDLTASRSKTDDHSREDLTASRSKTDDHSREDLTASRIKTDDRSREDLTASRSRIDLTTTSSKDSKVLEVYKTDLTKKKNQNEFSLESKTVKTESESSLYVNLDPRERKMTRGEIERTNLKNVKSKNEISTKSLDVMELPKLKNEDDLYVNLPAYKKPGEEEAFEPEAIELNKQILEKEMAEINQELKKISRKKKEILQKKKVKRKAAEDDFEDEDDDVFDTVDASKSGSSHGRHAIDASVKSSRNSPAKLITAGVAKLDQLESAILVESSARNTLDKYSFPEKPDKTIATKSRKAGGLDFPGNFLGITGNSGVFLESDTLDPTEFPRITLDKAISKGFTDSSRRSTELKSSEILDPSGISRGILDKPSLKSEIFRSREPATSFDRSARRSSAFEKSGITEQSASKARMFRERASFSCKSGFSDQSAIFRETEIVEPPGMFLMKATESAVAEALTIDSSGKILDAETPKKSVESSRLLLSGSEYAIQSYPYRSYDTLESPHETDPKILVERALVHKPNLKQTPEEPSILPLTEQNLKSLNSEEKLQVRAIDEKSEDSPTLKMSNSVQDLSNSEPCLTNYDLNHHAKIHNHSHIFLDSNPEDHLLNSYENSMREDEFFLVQYPDELAEKSHSEPNVLERLNKPTTYRYRIAEYYNDIEDCLKSFREAQSLKGFSREMSDEEIFNEIPLPVKSRSAPDVLDNSFVTLTYDPGPGVRRKSFVPGYNIQSDNVPMTVCSNSNTMKNVDVSNMLEKHWGPTRVVTLERDPQKSLGISIVGGKVDLYHEASSETILGIFIKNVVPDSPAGRCGELKTGDRILEVSGFSLKNISHEKAVGAIKYAKNPVTLVVQSLIPYSNNEAAEFSNEVNCASPSSPHPSPVKSASPAEATQPKKSLPTQKSVEFSELVTVNNIDAPPENTESKESAEKPKAYESSDESDDEEDVRDLEGRTVSAKGQDIDRASAANLKRTKEEIAADPEEEDDFGYTMNKVKKKYTNLGHSVVMVQLERSAGQGLGLSLAGHKDRNCMAVFVCGINPAGAAHRAGGIQVGDEILEVNGVVLHGRCHLNASAIIKGLSGPTFKLIILRRKAAIDDIAVRPITQFPVSLAEEASEESFSNYPNVRTISIKKGSQSLGIMIIEGKHAEVGQGIFISDIQEGSSAEKAGLEIGEMILAVNKDSLLGSNYDTAANLLKRTEGLVTLVVSNPGKKASTPTPDDKNASNKALKAAPATSRPTTPTPEPPADPTTCAIAPGRDTTIEIVSDNKTLGLCFVGGKDTAIGGGIVVVEVYAGGAAEKDGRLQPGDQILDVNGTSLKDATYNAASQALRQTLPKMKLIVYRSEKPDFQVIDTEFTKKPGKGMGLSVVAKKSGKGVYVSEILNGGCADVDGKIMRGDLIVSVNGQNVDSSSGEEAGAILKTITGKVNLKLHRYKPATR